MKKVYCLFFRLFIFSVLFLQVFFNTLYAAKVEEQQARLVAVNWYRHHATGSGKEAAISKVMEYKYQGRTSFYICSFDKGGFVLVSANDAAVPVLGYGFDHPVPDTITNESVKGWFEGYARQIDTTFVLNMQSDASRSKWEEVLSNAFPKSSATVVAPMLTTTWSQGWPYNALCPEGTWTGCVATAMAQIMKYHNWPEQGLGSFSYDWGEWGTCPGNTYSANFGETYYNFASMPNYCTTVDSNVARLMYHCGVSCGSWFGSGGTLVSYQGGQDPMSRAFKNFFRYSGTTIRQDAAGNYPASVWDSILQADLLNNRPVLYRGDGTGGHAFVCDGVDASGYYHFNFGWGGSYDGYYSLSAILPGGNNFTNNQMAVLGIFPNEGSTLVENTTWSGTVQFTQNVTIPDAITVTVAPGSTIKFGQNCRLQVYGQLISSGTEQNMNRFTAIDTALGWNGICWDNTWMNRMVMADNDSSRLTFTQIEYSKNSGILCNSFDRLNINHCKITRNYSVNGGGLSINYAPITLFENEIYNNEAAVRGGGISVSGFWELPGTIEGNYIHDNLGVVGGGFHLESSLALCFKNNIVSHNHAGRGAGGMLIHVVMSLINNKICNNSTTVSYGSGGGIHMLYWCDAKLINNLIANNTAGAGGALCIEEGAEPILYNNTISNNQANYSTIMIQSGVSPVFKNNIIHGNYNANGIAFYLIDANSNAIIDHCNIEGGINAIGGPGGGSNYNSANFTSNIDSIPMFVSPSAGPGPDYDGLTADWQLQTESPCVNTGDTAGISPSLPGFDLAGNPRINGIIDMGAYEYTPLIPAQMNVGDTLTGGQSVCYHATQTITVAGNGDMFKVESGASAEMIAGQNIRMLPGTTIDPGGYLYGHIAPGGPWCQAPLLPVVVAEEGQLPGKTVQSSFNLYPNPTTGNFFLELTGDADSVSVDIYGVWGEKVLNGVMTGERRHEFSLTGQPAGVYIVRVITGEKSETKKIVKQE